METVIEIFDSNEYNDNQEMTKDINNFLKDLQKSKQKYKLTWLQSSESNNTVLTCIVEYNL